MNKSLFKKILGLIKPYSVFILISLLAALVTIVMQLYAPILSGRAIDMIVDKGNINISNIVKVLIRFAIVIGIAIFAQWIMGIINNKVVYRIVKDIRTSVYKKINKLPISYIDSHEYGDIVSRMLTDVDQFSDGLLMGFTQLFTGVITILGTIFFMIKVNVYIALVVILLTPLSLFVASFVARKTYHMFKKQAEERSNMTSLVNEMVGSEKVVQAFSYEDIAQARFDDINERLVDAEFKATFFSSLTNPSTRLINNIVYAAVGIFGAFAVIAGKISVGQLTCLLSYSTQYAKPFNEISGVVTEMQSAFASIARVFELLEETPESDDTCLMELKDTVGNVNIENIDFSYTPDTKLITDLTLDVKQGERIAIVGPTGSGKSTIINLLMRFYDVDKGTIKVDGNDINSVTRNSLRAGYGMVLQETWLKSGTIRENIAYGKPDASLDEIKEAARLTHADRFIRRLPDGYDTYISEDGGNLSIGQKQLLCITRVMLSLPPMLILDEATSSIDTRTEQRIQRSFIKMMKGRTSFIVAHRLSTIKESDVILVMKDGAVIEQGSHEELLKADGFYNKLYISQVL